MRTHFRIGDKVTLRSVFFHYNGEKRSRIVRVITHLHLTKKGLWAATVTGDKKGQFLRDVLIMWLKRLDGSKFRRKITIHQRDQMRELFKNGFGIHYIARKFKCWPNAVWNHVYDLSPSRKISIKEKKHFTKNSILTDADIIRIRQMANRGYGSPQIRKLFGISQSAAIGIINGRTYRWVESKTRKGFLKPIEMERIRRKTDLRPGAKLGSKQSVPSGTLIKLAKKYRVAPCTIRRWIVKEKIHVD